MEARMTFWQPEHTFVVPCLSTSALRMYIRLVLILGGISTGGSGGRPFSAVRMSTFSRSWCNASEHSVLIQGERRRYGAIFFHFSLSSPSSTSLSSLIFSGVFSHLFPPLSSLCGRCVVSVVRCVVRVCGPRGVCLVRGAWCGTLKT